MGVFTVVSAIGGKSSDQQDLSFSMLSSRRKRLRLLPWPSPALPHRAQRVSFQALISKPILPYLFKFPTASAKAD